jgi:hypothetical protein
VPDLTLNIRLPVRVRFSSGTAAQFEYADHAGAVSSLEIHQNLARRLAEMTRTNFGPSDRGYRPAPWPPYSPAYAKRIKYSGPPTLFRRGVLHNSIKPTANAQYGEVVADPDRDYASAQQFGNPPHLPARPYFPVVDSGGGSYDWYPPAQRELERVAEQTILRNLRKMAIFQ